MPDERTPEQIEAQDQLQVAIENHVRAYRKEFASADVEVTGDWLLVAGVTSLDLDTTERRYAYHLAFSGGEMPEHVAYGLLRMADDLLENGHAA